MTIKSAFDYTVYSLLGDYDRKEATNISRLILKEIFKISYFDRTDEFVEEEELKAIIKRLKRSEPIDYIIGHSNFFGYEFMVNKHVLIPRPETEELVNWILEDNKNQYKQKDVIDIGSGSGCIGITLKKKKPPFRVFALEESMDAMNCTRINAKRLRTNLEFFRTDFLDRSIWNAFGAFDIIVSNPPYISMSEKNKMSENTLGYEPEKALFTYGNDPLVFYRYISRFAKDHLNVGGAVYVEMNEFRVKETRKIFESIFDQVEIRKDMQGKERMLRALGMKKKST